MPRTKTRDGNIYGQVESLEDIREINEKIRHEMDGVTSREELTELKKRSDYLCALAAAPSWKRKFGDKIDRFMEVAKETNARTTSYANDVARRHGWVVDYDPWGR